MRVLVDTSVWSLALRRRTPRDSPEVRELRELVVEGRGALLGVVRQEVLSGVRSADDFARLRAALSAFPDVVVETRDHERAAEWFNRCRSQGIQGSNADLLICAVSERIGAPILSTDIDFEHYARAFPVRLHQPRVT